ncbi:MAG: Arm DNA-binding domain-containing protein [Candidatus Accumulibacter sp.]|jgi:hypothetical protein|nr:Arm DNA-binding domain-containing protein [Accumulibacter sp.]
MKLNDALTDTQITDAKPADKPRKLADGKGLHLVITSNGHKFWRLKYRFDGREKLLSFGKYPAVGLKDARERRDEARKLLANGDDPSAVKKAQKAERMKRAANASKAVAGK